MDRKRWNLVEEIFEQVVERPVEEREAFLVDACGGDEELLAEVRSILDADTTSHSLLDGLAIDAFDAADVVESFAMSGRTIGPYRLVRQLGMGGMGAVYLAERVDGQFEQQVALKIIKRGLDSEQILTRFAGERQILARLQHPNVARLLDGGVSDDGVPYFTMEYVEGTPLDKYCDDRHLSINERLDLFMQACEAVSYAQHSLVVHRDLKPSNIMVTREGKVKLLDFGIAKLLDDDDDASGLTRTGHRLMTPGYASPEQVRGEAVTTATDVYALGVVLYELLTGLRPYSVDTSTPQEIERAIVDSSPQRPSVRVTRAETAPTNTTSPEELSRFRSTQPKQLRRRLRGDLDNICLKALRKEPDRRYSSAEALLADLIRHREGRPVTARADTVGYRLQKFVQRNTAGVATTVAIVAVIVALVAYYTTQLAAERDRARLEAQKAESVSDFLVSLFQVADPNESPGETVTARELLDRGAGRIREELTDQPEVQAKMMTVVGRVYHLLGLYEPADTLLRESLAMRKAIYGDEHVEVMETLGFVTALVNDMGRGEELEELAREVLRQRRMFLGDEHESVALALNDLGWVLYEKDRQEEAERCHREALAIRRVVHGDDSPETAESLNNLAIVLLERGNVLQAEPLFLEALAIRKKHFGDAHPFVAGTVGNLAVLYEGEGKYDEAEEYYRQSIEIQEKALGPDHPELATACVNLARTLRTQGRLDEAEPILRRAIALDSKRGENHPYVAYDLKELGSLLHSKGALEESRDVYVETLRIYRLHYGEEHGYVVGAKIGLGAVLLDMDRPEQAEPLLTDALAENRAAYPAGHRRIGTAESYLGACYLNMKRYSEAAPLINSGYETLRAALGEDNPRTQRAAKRVEELNSLYKP